uniref:MADS-box domain-containing protein n=1 Tax=Quercus lobata TaxID=97700 RepID=A0A7N2MJS5_QUELO
MESKKTKGKQKIEMKKIDKEVSLVTFSKRRFGINKKASELVTLCGAEVGVVVFSPAGKPFSFGHPSVESVANRFLKRNPPQAQEDSSTHTLEAQYWRVRINELNQQCDELLRQLEAYVARTRIRTRTRTQGYANFLKIRTRHGGDTAVK